MKSVSAALAATLALTACSLDRLDHLGRAPTMSPVGHPNHAIDPRVAGNPAYGGYGRTPMGAQYDPRLGVGAPQRLPQNGYSTQQPGGYGRNQGHGGYQQATHNGGYYPDPNGYVPRPHPPTAEAASLWSSSPQSLFGDRRARGIGDILTVVINIDDEAQIANTTTRSRGGSEEMGVSTVFGFEKVIERTLLPDGGGLDPGVSANSTSSSNGKGQVQRNEEISLRIAATVLEVLPNGHFVVTGNQEVRVNYELRDLQIAGIIRPEDISRRNEITYDKMANARISYGGRGQISDLQQPRYGQQVIDIISPF